MQIGFGPSLSKGSQLSPLVVDSRWQTAYRVKNSSSPGARLPPPFPHLGLSAFLVRIKPQSPSQLKSVLGVGDPPSQSYFRKMRPRRSSKPLKHKGIFAVGLIAPFLSYLTHNNTLNPVGFDSVLPPWPATNCPQLAGSRFPGSFSATVVGRGWGGSPVGDRRLRHLPSPHEPPPIRLLAFGVIVIPLVLYFISDTIWVITLIADYATT